jgi:hypothetical protein
MEQITYLLFIRRLDDLQILAEKKDSPAVSVGGDHAVWPSSGSPFDQAKSGRSGTSWRSRRAASTRWPCPSGSSRAAQHWLAKASSN